MNRIHNFLDDELDSSWMSAAAETAVVPAGDARNPHCVFTPQHYEHNYAYPLVVWLHGPDGDERQVNRVMPLVSLRNYVAVGIRGTIDGSVATSFDWSQDAAHIEQAEDRVLAAIRSVRRWLNISPPRIYLAGYGSGGTMALRLGLSQPDRFAGVLSIGGALPRSLRPLARLHEVRKLNLFLATGRTSEDYPESQVCDDLRLLHTAGMSIHLRQYPCGDDVTTDMLSDMDRWIMEQVASTPMALQDQPSEPRRK